MTDYREYKSEDLLLDESFLNFCKNPDGPESQFWNSTLSQYPALAVEASKALKLYSLLAISVPENEKRNLLKQVTDELQQNSSTPVLQIHSHNKKNWIRYAVAAALVGIIACTLIVFKSGTASRANELKYSSISFDQVYSAGDNERREVTLPDGSTVTLNYGSKLKIASDYNQKSRALYLDGEGFFSVQKDATRPFIVITNKTATTALGTSFKVRSYPGETAGNVMLATGKVKVELRNNQSAKNDPVFLIPGEQADWNNSQRLQKQNFDHSILDNWRVTHIEFDKADLREIISSLEFNYGIQVRLENNPVNAIGFTGKFDSKSLKDVLEAVAYTNKFAYSHNGNIVSTRFQ